MRYTIFDTVLAAGMALALSSPAKAQVTFSLGGNGQAPAVTFGQPYYNNGYAYGQPGYGGAYQPYPGSYYAPRHSNSYSPGYYSSGYRGYYAPAPGYRPSPYYAPQTGYYNGTGYATPYRSNGVYLNTPGVGTIRLR